MYNYFMLIGIVEEVNNSYLKLKVKREFGAGEDHFKIMMFDFFIDLISETPLNGKKICIKGRMVQNETNLELVAERIIFL